MTPAYLRGMAALVALTGVAGGLRSQPSSSVATGAPPARAEAAGRPSLEEWQTRGANASRAKIADAARKAKMAAVDKVSSLLEDLMRKILADGEAESATYNRFSCFCKDTTIQKTDAIETGKDSKATLEANIAKLSSKRVTLDSTIAGLVANIEQLESDASDATETRTKEQAEYRKNAADIIGAIEGLDGAMKVLKASKATSLVQFQTVAQTVHEAALLADALGLGAEFVKRMPGLLQQAPSVNMEDYKFHSDEIIKTLGKLNDDFRAEKVSLDKEEVKAVAMHQSLMQEKADALKQKNIELEDAKREKAHTQEAIGSNNEELTTVAATLLDDQEYLKQLAQMCSDKAKTWDQRSKVRQDELSALTAAVTIIKEYVGTNTSAATLRLAQQVVSVRRAETIARSPSAMEAVEAAAEVADEDRSSAPPAFVQRSQMQSVVQQQRGFLRQQTAEPVTDTGPQRAVFELLRSRGDELKSTLLTSLASRIAADHFAKVKQLIQELVERLQQEAGNEANHKGWCDKSTADAEQKRDLAAGAIQELNGQMMELEAKRDQMLEDIAELSAEIKELMKSRVDAEKLRAEEQAENEATVAEAKAGKQATTMAMDVLSRFYKTVDDSTVDLSLAQRGPADDAPAAGFEIGEAYAGSQGEAGGIVGMLEVIHADFERTVRETQKAEAEAEQDHLVFMTETGTSLSEKNVAKQEKTKYKDNAEEKLATTEEDLQSQTEILKMSVKELMELKPVCVDTGMTYQERVALRENEIEALKKALCILEAYAQYGPGGKQEC